MIVILWINIYQEDSYHANLTGFDEFDHHFNAGPLASNLEQTLKNNY